MGHGPCIGKRIHCEQLHTIVALRVKVQHSMRQIQLQEGQHQNLLLLHTDCGWTG